MARVFWSAAFLGCRRLGLRGCREVWILDIAVLKLAHSRYERFSDLTRTGKVTDAIIAESSRSRRLSRSRRGVDFYHINNGGVYLTLN